MQRKKFAKYLNFDKSRYLWDGKHFWWHKHVVLWSKNEHCQTSLVEMKLSFFFSRDAFFDVKLNNRLFWNKSEKHILGIERQYLQTLCVLKFQSKETKFELLIYWSENLDQDEIGISEDEFDDLQSLFQVKCCIKFTNDEIQKIQMEIHEQKWQMLSRDTGRYIWVIVSDLQIQYPKAFLSGYTRCCNKTHSWKENTFLLYQRRKRDFFLKA